MRLYKILVLLISLFIISELHAFQPRGRDFGFGVVLGEPSGVSLNIFTTRDQSLALALGNSALGDIAVGGDYIWHFNAFNSSIFNLYAGPGIKFGFGDGNDFWYDRHRYYRNDVTVIALKGAFGVNCVPRNSAFEIFAELQPHLVVSPGTDFGFAFALGFRFYP